MVERERSKVKTFHSLLAIFPSLCESSGCTCIHGENSGGICVERSDSAYPHAQQATDPPPLTISTPRTSPASLDGLSFATPDPRRSLFVCSASKHRCKMTNLGRLFSPSLSLSLSHTTHLRHDGSPQENEVLVGAQVRQLVSQVQQRAPCRQNAKHTPHATKHTEGWMLQRCQNQERRDLCAFQSLSAPSRHSFCLLGLLRC